MEKQPPFQYKAKASIILDKNINTWDIINNCYLILYNPLCCSEVEKIVGKKVQDDDSPHLIKGDNIFWVTNRCQKEDKISIDQIERLIGLTFTIICIEISNHLEVIIQKAFGLALNEALQFGNQIKLIFVKSTYKRKTNTSQMKYCSIIGQALQLISNDTAKCPIKVIQLLQIYDCQLAQNVARVRQIYQRYENIRMRQQKIQAVQNEIFAHEQKATKIQRQLLDLSLSKQKRNKLLWKLQRMKQFKELLQEQAQIVNIDYSGWNFKDLHSKVNLTALVMYRKQWTANSLRLLKKIFNNIQSKDDSSADKFQADYRTMKKILQELEKQLDETPYCFAILEMSKQLQYFYNYHHCIIQGQQFGFFKYFKDQLKFNWRYNNQIFKKMIAFCALTGFAAVQSNYIYSVTIFSVSLLILALRC